MKNWKQFFKGKKVTLMGLGLLGRGVGDAAFLAECGAEVLVTDLKPSTALGSSLQHLRKCKNIKYVLGKHRHEDFKNRDFILKAAGVPLDSPYIAEAKKNNIPIEMDASLFAKLMPQGVVLVGVTGTRGKSTTTALIYEILKTAKKRVFKGGNLVPEATLSLLKKIKAGDIVVLELDSWQLQGFHDVKISPQVAVFTTFLDDHLSYYRSTSLTASRQKYFEDKTAIFRYQKKGDVLVVGEQALKRARSARPLGHGRLIVARAVDVPKEWKIKLLGEHNRENIACALKIAKHFNISANQIKKTVEHFKAIPGRLEYLRTVRGVKIYNDNNATTPDATIAALRALSPTPNVDRRQNIGCQKLVLICGGTNKGLDMSKLVAEMPKHCKAVVLLKESGTEKLKKGLADFTEKETLKECVQEAMKIAQKGDIILFSPAFASFGKWFKNEYDRGEQFVELIKCLK